MRIETNDMYIDCQELIIEANDVYKEIENDYNRLHTEDILYIESMNRYINNYEKFKEKQIKQYIEDLKKYKIHLLSN